MVLLQGNFLRGRHRFRPYEKLRSSADFTRVKTSGKRFRTAHFRVNFSANGLRFHRLGLIVQKRFWSAVDRNRIKRCLREWFRLHKLEIPQPAKDIVIIAWPGAEGLSPAEMAKELLAAFMKQDDRSS